MIGYDAGKQLKEAIRAGTVAGAISQDPVGIGYKCVEAAVKAIKGETVPNHRHRLQVVRQDQHRRA